MVTAVSESGVLVFLTVEKVFRDSAVLELADLHTFGFAVLQGLRPAAAVRCRLYDQGGIAEFVQNL